MVDWSKPLEHVDGTPLVLKGDTSQYPSEWGDYRVVREDGKPFTERQCGIVSRRWLLVRPDGTLWSTGVPVVRNRTDTIDERMTRLIRAVADDRGNPLSGEDAAIVADLPADPLLVRAREIAAAEMERAGHVAVAVDIRSGERDDDPAVRAVLVALRERDV